MNGAKSSISEVTSGVFQGTVLGPLLLFIMINDIYENISASIYSTFANDTTYKSYQQLKTYKTYNPSTTSKAALKGQGYQALIQKGSKSCKNYL